MSNFNDRRKTVLTAAGVAFREDATAALLRLDQAVHRARLVANGKLGILRIGFISTAGNEIVPTIVRRFLAAIRLCLAEPTAVLLRITVCQKINILRVLGSATVADPWLGRLQLAVEGFYLGVNRRSPEFDRQFIWN